MTVATLPTNRTKLESPAQFIEPMLCLAVRHLPEGAEWEYELKLDGYRIVGVRSEGRTRLYSRNGKNFSDRFLAITKALEELPDETAIDGEVVAVDEDGRPSFNALQDNKIAPLHFYAFDLMTLAGEDLTRRTLDERRNLLKRVTSRLKDPIRFSETFDTTAAEMIGAVREQGL